MLGRISFTEHQKNQAGSELVCVPNQSWGLCAMVPNLKNNFTTYYLIHKLLLLGEEWKQGEMLRAGVGKTFFVKGQGINILGSVGHTVSVATTHVYHCMQKQPETNEQGCVPIKLYHDMEIWISCNFYVSWNILLLLSFPNHLKI